VVSEQTAKESFRWNDFKLDHYYWRVAARSSDGETGIFSEGVHVDLRTIPEGPVTAAYQPKETPATKPKKKIKMVKTIIAESTPPPKVLPPLPPPAIIKEIPESKVAELESEENNVWNFSFEFGGHGTFTNYWGNDYVVKTLGPQLGDFRLAILPPYK